MTSSLTTVIIISWNLIHVHILADVCRRLLLPDKVISVLLLMARSRDSKVLSLSQGIHVTMQKEVAMLGYIDSHAKELASLCQK